MQNKILFLSLLAFLVIGFSSNAQQWVKIEGTCHSTTCAPTGSLYLVCDSAAVIDSVYLGTTGYDVSDNDTVYLDGLAPGVYDSLNFVRMWDTLYTISYTYEFGTFQIDEDGPDFYSQQGTSTVCGYNGTINGIADGDYARIYDTTGYTLVDEAYVNYSGGWMFDSLPPGVYRVEIRDWYGCAVHGPLFEIAPAEVSTDVVQNTTACGAEGYISANGTNTDSLSLWINDTTWIETGDFGLFVDSLMPGNYQIVAYAQFGCQNDTAQVTIAPRREEAVTVATTNTAWCGSNHGTASVTFDRDIVAIPGYYATFTCEHAEIDSLLPGIHTVVAELVNGCYADVPIFIGTDNQASVGVREWSPSCGEATDGGFEYNLYGPADSLTYDGVRIDSVGVVDSLPAGTGTLLIYDRGCEFVVNVDIPVSYDECLDVYWTFTPNNDGYNDVLMIRGPSNATIHITVFDGYGKVVYDNLDYQNNWDGTYNGTPLPDGDYRLKGTITFGSGSVQEFSPVIVIKR